MEMSMEKEETPNPVGFAESGTSFLTSSEDVCLTKHAASSRCCSVNTQKIVIGCIIVVLLAISWVGTQQYAQSAVQLANFDAPYFTTWLGTCWVTLCFPGYCLFVVVKERRKNQIMRSIRDSIYMFGRNTPISTKLFFTRVLPMNIIWLVTNYLYIFGLKFIAATDASAIFASNVAFVYLMSLCILQERLFFIKVLSCLTCMTGVVLFAYVEGFSGGSQLLVGVLMATASALGAALYKVIFKKMVGSASLGQVSLFLSLLGTCNALFMWIVFVILYVTGVEYFESEDIPWSALNMSNFLGLVFNFLVNFGVAYTYPLFISIAMLLGVPLNAVVDIFVKDVSFSVIRLVAGFLVVLGFTLMLFPDNWNQPIHSVLMCEKPKESASLEVGKPDAENPEVNMESDADESS